MKVRFDPAVKADPERVDGMKVHYSPARRQMPRLRWYLVILIVASPLIYLLGSFLVDQFVVSAKGQIAPPLFASICAAEEGVVESAGVRAGERVQPNQELLRMKSDPAKPAPESGAAPDNAIVVAVTSEADRARLRVDLARERFEKMKLLREQGAATTGEVEQARALWLSALDAQALLQKETPGMVGDAGAGRQFANMRVYDGRMYWSPGKGQVRDVCVQPGDRVERGQTLITMDLANEAQITAYLDPKHLRCAERGRRCKVIFPDGTHMRAEVVGAEEFSERPPADVPDPLGLRRRSLVVHVRVTEPIPPRLDIAGLPVTVRF